MATRRGLNPGTDKSESKALVPVTPEDLDDLDEISERVAQANRIIALYRKLAEFRPSGINNGVLLMGMAPAQGVTVDRVPPALVEQFVQLLKDDLQRKYRELKLKWPEELK